IGKIFVVAKGACSEMVIHEVVPQLAAVVTHALRESICFGAQEYPAAGQCAGVHKNNAGEIFRFLFGMLVQNYYPAGFLLFIIKNDLGDNGVWPQGHVACYFGGGQGGGLAAEVCTIRTAPDTAVAVLAFSPAVVRLCEV